MGETLNNSARKDTERNLVASGGTYNHITSLRGKTASSAVCDVSIFLLKLAALETARRVSSAKCPHIWHTIQGLQVFCYPPLKWLQRWAPFKGMIKGMQMLSKPLLVLSIATAFSDQSERSSETSDSNRGSPAYPELQTDPQSIQSPVDGSVSDEAFEVKESNDWLIRVCQELKNQGITIPKSINNDVLRRFHTAANGDFSSALSSIKKTIRWRYTFRFLSERELEPWSNLVFWHGYDVDHRPCLIVRLGVALINLTSSDRPCFAQAIISQVEHGVLHYLDAENDNIAVLVDCEGLSPLKIPMEMMRTSSSLLQHHYPNLLGRLFVIRLPPVVRVMAQTFLQVVKPVTRKKFKFEGETFHKLLSEYLQTLPSYLGGDCRCQKCSIISSQDKEHSQGLVCNAEGNIDISDSEDLPTPSLTYQHDGDVNRNFNQVFRTAIISLLMLWALIALLAATFDP